MAKGPEYVSRVLLAVADVTLEEIRKPLRRRDDFHILLPEGIDTEGLSLAIQDMRPDILVLDMTLPELETDILLSDLSIRRLPPYVVAIAPLFRPYLLGLQKYKAVRGVLPYALAFSPVLRQVLMNVAEGGTYFFSSPPPDRSNLNLTPEEVVLVALIAAGLSPNQVAQELGLSRHNAYTRQSLLRKKLGVRYNEEIILMGIGNGLAGVLVSSGGSTRRSA